MRRKRRRKRRRRRRRRLFPLLPAYAVSLGPHWQLAETASEPGSTSPEPPVHNIFSPRPSPNLNPPQICRHANKILPRYAGMQLKSTPDMPACNQNPPQICRHKTKILP